jgi:hypothetical protein
MKILILSFLCATISFAQSYVPGHLTVILKSEALQGMTLATDWSATLPNATSLNALNSAQGLIAMRPLSTKSGSPFRFFFDFEFPTSADLNNLVATYSGNSFVTWVSKNSNDPPIPLCGPAISNDAAFPSLWPLHDATDVDINAPEAWEWTKGDTNIILAFTAGGVAIDSTTTGWLGYRKDVGRQVWTNLNEIANNGGDDDSNRFVDDLHGWNTWSIYDNNDIEARVSPGRNYNSFYLIRHGSGDTGWGVAQEDDTPFNPTPGNDDVEGLVGAAPRCRFMSISTLRGIHRLPGSTVYIDSKWSIIYATENGARALSASFLVPYRDTTYRPFVDSAFAHGLLFVNAYGNVLSDTGYASPNALSVQILQHDNTLAPGQPRSSLLNICAPSLGGSSEAAPVVAGVLGLMISVNPYLSAQSLRSILVNTRSCNPVNTPNTGVGRVDALKAIRNASGAPDFYSIKEGVDNHPYLEWKDNSFIPSVLPSPFQHVVQRQRAGESCFSDIAVLSGSTYSYTDMQETIVGFGSPTEYRIRARLPYGSNSVLSVASSTLEVRTDGGVGQKVAAPGVTPSRTQLVGNSPNPFNPSTTIAFDLADPTFVSLKVYNVLGQEMATLVNETLHPGRYVKVFDATSLSSGVYFYRMSAGTFVETRKLMLSK